MRRGDELDRRVEVVKAFVGDQRSDISSDAAAGIVLVNDDQAMSLGNRIENRLIVERESVRGSMTSASIPSSESAFAAASACWTMREIATIVTSSPIA